MRDVAPEYAKSLRMGNAAISVSPSPDVSPLPRPYWGRQAYFSSKCSVDEFQLLITIFAFWLDPKSISAFGKGNWDRCFYLFIYFNN